MRKIFTLILAAICALSPLRISYAQEDISRISLDIKGMDVLDVFKILSMRSNLNIVAGKNVRGNVTMFLKDVDVWDAFEIILAANDLAYEKHGNIISVMTQRDYELLYGEKYQDRRVVKTVKLKYARVEDVSAALNQIKTNIGKVVADEPSKSVVLMDVPYKIEEMIKIIESLDMPVITKVYVLKYAKAADLKDKITEKLTKNIGGLQVDERTNKIAVTDTEKKIAEIDKVIAAFDEKHKEVEIEAMILELTLNDEYPAGITCDIAFHQLSSTLSKTLGDHVVGVDFSRLGTILPATSSSTTQKGLAYDIGDVGTKGFRAIVEFLQTYGRTRILSNPRITVLNNEEAKILVGKNQPYVTTTQSQGETTTVASANVTYLDLGVKLTVTPTINDDGFVTIKVKPEVSSSSSSVEYTISTGVTNTVPIVETSTTETTVMIKDRHSIMLSGLIQKRDEIEEKKVPGLSNIPILGNLFKSTKRGNATASGSGEPERKEIIIFLTPRITHGENEKLVEEVGQQRQQEKEKRQILHEEIQQKLTEKKLQDAQVKMEQAVSVKRPMPGKRTAIWNENMGVVDYYKLIWQRGNERVVANKPKQRIEGEVTVTFILSSGGRLAEVPKVYAYENTDPALIQIALACIEEATPFPQFPSSVEKESEIFNITISYE